MDVVVAGGVESISLTQTKHMNTFRAQSDAVLARLALHVYPDDRDRGGRGGALWREPRDAGCILAAEPETHGSGGRCGRFAAEIVPLPSRKAIVDKVSGETRYEDVVLDRDEGPRADTTLEGLAKLEPVWSGGKLIPKGRFITAGNASQLSDGAAACVIMEAAEASRRGLEPLGVYRGMAVAGCAPEEMGIGPVFAVPKLLKNQGVRPPTSICGSSTRPSPSRPSIAATAWGWTTTSSTSTAAQSRWATRTA